MRPAYRLGTTLGCGTTRHDITGIPYRSGSSSRRVPHLNITTGEPGAEIWGVMLFPEDEGKRQAYIARLWERFYPTYETNQLGEPVPRSVLLWIMKAAGAVDRVDKAEIKARRWGGLLAGEQLKVLTAIAQSQPKRASWNAASKLVRGQTGISRAVLYEARGKFLPVIHLWAAYILRGQQFAGDPARGYTALDDIGVFVAEAMALLQWGTSFRLDRKGAEPALDRSKVDFWVPPPDWSPPAFKDGWPRDGRLAVPTLPEVWLRRVGAKPMKYN
jgi:hypothetical protein